MRAHPGPIDDDEGSVQNIEPPLFDEQDGGAILDRDGARRRNSGYGGHGRQILRVVRQVPPPALALSTGNGAREPPSEGLPRLLVNALSPKRREANTRSELIRQALRFQRDRGERSP